MTIQEAIKSGKPFKRDIDKHLVGWYFVLPNGKIMWITLSIGDEPCERELHSPDLLADDWEVKE